jgi:hypothetical protein
MRPLDPHETEPTTQGADAPAAPSARGRRDSLFGEPISRVYVPRAVPPPMLHRVAAAMLAALALVTTLFAMAVARALHVPIGGSLVVAAWLSGGAIYAYAGTSWWRRAVRVQLTNQHVVWRRGRLKRSIDLRTISFARIHWHPSVAGVGDLELVRSVPTGALRRTLAITLPDLEAPDAVWAEIRGVQVTGVLGDARRPVGQRLDRGERVLWTEQPQGGRWSWDASRAATLFIALVAAASAVRAILSGAHALRVVAAAGLSPRSMPFGALAVAMAVSVLAVLATASVAGYYALLRPSRLRRSTRYVVTDRRVLIQRGAEELHLDRDRIVDVIDAPQNDGSHDLFLVVGAKNAHAHALAGAFGERARAGTAGELQPVLRAVHDSDTVRAILALPAREAA